MNTTYLDIAERIHKDIVRITDPSIPDWLKCGKGVCGHFAEFRYFETPEVREQSLKDFRLFKEYFCPPRKGLGSYWFGSTDKVANQEKRLFAMLLMHEMTE